MRTGEKLFEYNTCKKSFSDSGRLKAIFEFKLVQNLLSATFEKK